MFWLRMPLRGTFCVVLLFGFHGCTQAPEAHSLDPALARSSVQKAMQAWVDGKTPADVKPIIVGDPEWNRGMKLVSFEILTKEETTDGSNLHIQVFRRFGSYGAEPKVTYIVGTSPEITIFPQ